MYEDMAANSEHKEWQRLEKNGEWNEDYAKIIMDEISTKPRIEINGEEINTINILVLGQIKSGKSAFINTVASIDKQRIAQVTNAGSTEKSVTSKLKHFTLRNNLKSFKLFDTMGFETSDEKGLNIRDIMFIVKGNVPDYYQFNPVDHISERSEGFKKDPTISDRVHCVVFVMDATLVGQDNTPPNLVKKIKELRDELHAEDIPRIVLLTKIDILCGQVDGDITKTYESENVRKAVGMASDIFCLPEQNIFPVQNYADDMERNEVKEILTLLALRQMVRFATDHLEALPGAKNVTFE